ncbi:MAG: enoyl-CoA hydratase/isomerase family protein [Dehalococcoidia bacterium]
MSSVLLEKRDGIAYVTLARPEALNALNRPMVAQLTTIFQELEADEAMKVVLLTGQGQAFCAGYDVKQDIEYLERGETPPRSDLGFIAGDYDRLKPVICAVNGMAAGGGLYLVLQSDIVIASERAQFWPPYAARGRDGGPQPVLLAMKTNLSWASWACLLAQKLDAQTALRMGLAQEMVPHEQLLPRVTEIAETLCGYSQVTLHSIKERLNHLIKTLYLEASRYRGPVTSRVFDSADFRKGLQAFLTKQKARFDSEGESTEGNV